MKKLLLYFFIVMTGAMNATTIKNRDAGPTGIAVTIINAKCGNNGRITLGAVTGGIAPYTYSINGALYSTELIYYSLVPSNYTIDVKDTNGDVYSTSVTITDSPGPTAIAFTVVDATCNASDGSVTIVGITGGTAPYTYSFNNSGFTTNTTYSGFGTGSYILWVRDANGCQDYTYVTIGNSTGPTAIATTIVDEMCASTSMPGSVTLGTVTGGVAPYTYDFNNYGYSTTTVYNGLPTLNYPLKVKDANGCIYSSTIYVGKAGGPTAVDIITTNATCNEGGSVTFGTVTGGSPPYSFEGQMSYYTGYSTNTTYYGLPPGSLTFSVKDANGCTFHSSFSISYSNSGPTNLDLTIGTDSITIGAVTGGVAPFLYNFNYSGFLSTTFYGGLAPGTYVIQVKDANGCIFEKTAIIDSPLILTMSNGTYSDYNADGYVNAGDVVFYQFTVKNNGSLPMTNVVVSNPNITVTGSPIAILGAGATDNTTFTAMDVITQTNVDTRYVYNYGLATGTYNGQSVTDDANAYLTIGANDGFRLIAFKDTNNNGIRDSGEQNFTNGEFHYEVNNDGIVHNANSSYGIIEKYEDIPTNSYDFTYTIDSGFTSYCTVNPSSYSNITVPTGSGIIEYLFPITVVPYTELAIYLNPHGAPPRPGFIYTVEVVYRNLGTQNIGLETLTFTKDNALSILSTSIPTTATPTGFTYDFFYPLMPNETKSIIVTMQVPTIPTIQLGDLLVNSVSSTIPSGDINTSNNISSLTQTIVGSYDPNDKNESHGPEIVHSTFTSNDYLTYTIQFENTGTANAVTVKVDDVLDTKLDETSIKMIDASHNYTLDRVGNDLTWHFDGIDLPPSVAGTSIGKGYINFQVKPKAGYAIGDIINNTAYIYFDFNPAIVTNTFATEFVTALGVAGFVNSQFSAYPNPTTGIITIALKNSAGSIDNITVTDILGKTVLANTVNTSNTTVDLSNLTKGLYFVKIQAEGLVKTLKVVKE